FSSRELLAIAFLLEGDWERTTQQCHFTIPILPRQKRSVNTVNLPVSHPFPAPGEIASAVLTAFGKDATREAIYFSRHLRMVVAFAAVAHATTMRRWREK